MRRAYQLIFAAVAALALAGAASGQGNPVYGVQDTVPTAPSLGGAPPLDRPTARQIAVLNDANKAFHKACAAERQTMCADKTSDSTLLRCVRYHRLKVSAPCKGALDQLGLALNGAL